MTALGVLYCFALFVCLTLLASFFHLSLATCILGLYWCLVSLVVSFTPASSLEFLRRCT